MPSRMIFLNLPVRDVGRSMRFYTALGWPVHQECGERAAACVVMDDNICAMLLSTEQFALLGTRPVGDTRRAAHAVFGIALPSAAAVDALVDAALIAGGAEEINEVKRAGEREIGMHSRTFIDPDGHQWEPFYFAAPG